MQTYRCDNISEQTIINLCKSAMNSREYELEEVEWAQINPFNVLSAGITAKNNKCRLHACYDIEFGNEYQFVNVHHEWTKWIKFCDDRLDKIIGFGY